MKKKEEKKGQEEQQITPRVSQHIDLSIVF